MFSMFETLSFRDLVFGPDLGLIETMRYISGLEWGIENPILATLLYEGLLFTLLMTLAVGVFLREVARLSGRGIWLPMVAFVVLLNSAESLASKTLLLSQFAIIALCLYRPVPRSRRRT